MENLGHFRINNEFQAGDHSWRFYCADIANYRGITTHLDDIWLDWHDILSEPEEARMHMYPGTSKEVGLGIKHLRMETWQKAIVTFDSMMVDVVAPVEPEYVLELLREHKIPKPTRVALPTANPSLVKLLHSLDLVTSKTNEYIAEWKMFADVAANGGIVRPKRFLKYKSSKTNISDSSSYFPTHQ